MVRNVQLNRDITSQRCLIKQWTSVSAATLCFMLSVSFLSCSASVMSRINKKWCETAVTCRCTEESRGADSRYLWSFIGSVQCRSSRSVLQFMSSELWTDKWFVLMSHGDGYGRVKKVRIWAIPVHVRIISCKCKAQLCLENLWSFFGFNHCRTN